MLSLFNRIIGFGTEGLDARYKVAVVRTSNIIALIFLLAGLIYGLISFYLAPDLMSVCIILFVGNVLILLLNYFQMVDLSRLALNLLISLDVAIYHGYIVQSGEAMIESIYLGQFVVALLPWIYIDIREKWLLMFSLSISLFIFIAQPWTNEFLDQPMDSTIFRDNIFKIPTYAFSIMALLFSMYLLQVKNLNNEKRVSNMYNDIQERNKEMEKQQAALLKTLEENKKAAGLEEKRNWIAKGLSQFGDLLRGDLNERFYQQLTSSLVRFMKINQAGVYIVEEGDDEEKYINLKSCYAFDRNKFLEKKIKIGHGLIGQCYLEKERIFLREVPASYINITSGLGDATPKCILIVPMVQDTNVEGIIELASFHVLEEHEIEFVQKLAESLAAFVASNRINMKTKLLLEKFQQQSEELRAQEEEMRQNMEEMQATQEEIHRTEQEYVQRIAELELELEKNRDG
jgi:putative methionine-R-sulfoxide reductase with GAF domain